MTHTAPVRPSSDVRAPLRHGLAMARVRSLAVRPVGPMKVSRAGNHPIHHS